MMENKAVAAILVHSQSLALVDSEKQNFSALKIYRFYLEILNEDDKKTKEAE